MNQVEHQRQVGFRLGEVMAARNVKPKDIEKNFNISPQRLTNWLKGRHYPEPQLFTDFLLICVDATGSL